MSARIRVGVPRETAAGERQVALVPEAVATLVEAGWPVVVERGAGAAALFSDEAFARAGAALVESAWEADVVVKVRKPSAWEAARLRRGSVLIGLLEPLTDRVGIERLAARGVVAFALEQIPRIARAQAMDALSLQAAVAGYRAVLVAAERLRRFLPMLISAAATIRPARVLVLGCGVAGLEAIATAHRLGAIVDGFDVRAGAREQVESLEAQFLDLDLGLGAETADGDPAELRGEQLARERAELEQRLAGYDVVIAAAAVRGRPAPRLISAAALRRMRAGSVIVDLAAASGGNCELTEPGREIVREGVLIVGRLDLAGEMPADASRLYAGSVLALLSHLAPEGRLRLDFGDEITAACCVTRSEGVAA